MAVGLDVRIGLDDTTVLPGGRPAEGNAELVATAVAIARGAPPQGNAPAGDQGVSGASS